jgi:hypothetical protein
MKYLKSFNEMIKIPIKVGDTVLGGRFKNKKVVVKKIGKNDKGDITINDKPLLKYRILKESNESLSIFDNNWTKLLPQELNIITHNGEFNLKVKGLETEHGYPGIYNLMNSISFIYSHNTVESEDNDVTADGEPDTLQFDIAMVKDNDGSDANPKKALRLNIDLTYGDSMMYAFTIDYPNKVHVHHYNGKDSLYDSETHFGFTDESLKELIVFFNRFGFTTTAEDFTFIDSDLDSYDYERNHPQIGYKVPVKVDRLEPMIMNDEEKIEVDALKGGDKITKYSKFKSNKYSK